MKKKHGVKIKSSTFKPTDVKSINAEFINEAAEAIRRIGGITKRSLNEVFSDALRTYLWAIHQQTFGATVLSRKGRWENKLAHLIKNQSEALKYFEELGW